MNLFFIWRLPLMILMRGKDITWAILPRLGHESWDFFGPKQLLIRSGPKKSWLSWPNPSIGSRNVFAPHQNHNGPCHIINRFINGQNFSCDLKIASHCFLYQSSFCGEWLWKNINHRNSPNFSNCLIWFRKGKNLTINEPVDYMVRAVMILIRGKNIMWPNPSNGQVMSLPRIKIIRGKCHIKKQV